MRVDVIVPTYRPDETFCLLLHKLQEQTFLIHRLFIFNTEECLWRKADQTYAFGQTLGGMPFPVEICHISREEFDHGGTRKRGALQSQADIVLFLTQDAVPADAALVEQLAACFDLSQSGEGAVAAAYARQLPRDDCSEIERFTRQFNYPSESRKKSRDDIGALGIKTFFCSDVCAAYRMDIFRELGGFEEPVIFNEDMFFAAKAIMRGYAVYYAAKARVVHSHNYTMAQQFHRNFDLAVSQQQHPEIFAKVSSESEGMKLVKSTAKHLCAVKKPWLIVSLVLQSAAKYAGYTMGKRYRKLSRKRILKYTLSRNYWHRVWKED